MTLTLDRVILHTVVHHSSTSTYAPNFIEIEETYCGTTDLHTYVRTDGHLRSALLGRLYRTVDLKRGEDEGEGEKEDGKGQGREGQEKGRDDKEREGKWCEAKENCRKTRLYRNFHL